MDYNEVERGVLNQLGRESFRHVNKDDIIKFAVMMPDLPPEHALKVLEQFPDFARLVSEAVDSIEKTHQSSLENNQHSQDQFHEACKELRAILKGELGRSDITSEERKHVLDLLMEVLRMESAKDSENKRFIDSMYGKVVLGVSLGVLTAFAFVGGKGAFEGAAKAASDRGIRSFTKSAKALAKGTAKATIDGAGKAIPK
jgi:hypothetical protein